LIVDDDGREEEGGEVGNMMGSACSMTTATRTNTMMTMKMTMTANTTTRRMGRDCMGEQTRGGIGL
jgi:hypothetical protein